MDICWFLLFLFLLFLFCYCYVGVGVVVVVVVDKHTDKGLSGSLGCHRDIAGASYVSA